MFHSLRARLIVSYVVVILLTLCIAGLGLLFLLQDFQRGIMNQRLTDALGPATVQAREGLRRGLSIQTIANQIQEQVDPAWRVLFLDDQGTILADSQDEFTSRRFPRMVTFQNLGPFRFATGRQVVEGRELLFAAAPLGQRDNARLFLVLASVVRPIIGGLEDLVRPLLIAGITALVAAIVLALVLARSISQPLGQLTRATEAIARGKYAEQIPVRGNDEVGRLAASFNAMTRAVKRSQQVQKDFVANVSHELKTPLTSIQGFSQAIVDGATRDLDSAKYAARLIYEESLRMGRLVADLLTLARLDAGDVPLERQTLDLAAMLPAWVERFQTRAQAEKITLTLVLDSPPPIVGDAGRLEQVVTNLVDNALKYNKSGGSVQVYAGHATRPPTASTDKRAAPKAYALLRVQDTGQGISQASQARLFERFYRADPARVAGGSGLGLSIVQEIVSAHHGEITVASQANVGTTFEVWLPAQIR
ncbi:MAG: HAMP domain-containing protein [Chloroflexi bacterium]|nr:HAMP domain-containing protein [Chloroflexota bacterium]